ncbi:uncharacterized protein LOC131665205 isoform X2 [Phymastichus coffea]|uniref:uncharacterized protein LOC131665205 isoform X2 n=1 Tax=Phymastichus coffea TaxID=108790 RepID=UPI00273C7BA6|nr:uncharacterized protein LOC131665205 isoform X2 [Phymastichus coffea]
MTSSTILTVILVITCASLTADGSGLRQIITRNVSGVRLNDGHLMELVEEQTCSATLVRLTCRSLTSFVFVLEARYIPNQTNACVYDRESWCKYKKLFATLRVLQLRRSFLMNTYGYGIDEDSLDFRNTVNRRCSGHPHCRYRVMSDHPESLFWKPANIRIKYACIPETSVFKYCNAELQVPAGPGGFLKSPGYPLYYVGEITCGWTFRSQPGQRILLTFHDLNIREHERDGSCIDIVRVRDDGNTLFESCGTAAGVKIISNTNVVTLNLIASKRLYSARGFFLQYQGCPDVTAPPGSYVSNGSLDTRTFLCRAGTLFPDTGQRTRTIHCRHGSWEQSVSDLPACVRASSVLIVSSETDGTNRHRGLSGGAGSSDTNATTGSSILDLTTRTEGASEAAVVKTANYSIMDQTKSSLIKDGDYVVDVILPAILIVLLLAGNAVILYIISQYRKRNVDNNFRKTPAEVQEDIALNATSRNNSQV